MPEAPMDENHLPPAREREVWLAWQAGAISRDTMTELFRRGEVLPEGRNVQEEERLIAAEKRPGVVAGKAGVPVH